jgi:hypothetical protein
MTYAVKLDVDLLYRVESAASNRFFRKAGAPAGGGGSGSGSGGGRPAPEWTLTEDGELTVSGSWAASDGPLSLVFVLQDRDSAAEAFLAKFEKGYSVLPESAPAPSGHPAGSPPEGVPPDSVPPEGAAPDGVQPANAPGVSPDIADEDDSDSDCRDVQATGLIAVAASLGGRSADGATMRRRSSYFMECGHRSGWAAVSVADGDPGSARSRAGARIAARTAVEAFLDYAYGWECDGLAGEVEECVRRLKEAAEGEATLPATDPRFAAISKAGGSNAFSPGHVANSAILAYQAIAKEIVRRNTPPNPSAGGEGPSDPAAQGGGPSGQAGQAATGEGPSGQAGPAAPPAPVTLGDYNTTLTLAAFKTFPFGPFVCSFTVGDGGIAIFPAHGGGGKALVPGAPDTPGPAGRTRYLTEPELLTPPSVLERVHLSFPDGLEALVLATAGVTAPFRQAWPGAMPEEAWLVFLYRALRNTDGSGQGCPELFDDGCAFGAKRLGLMRWLDLRREGGGGDRTIVVVKRHPEKR